MPLLTRSFDEITEDQKAAIQVKQPLFNMSEGSVALALAEANSGLALFIQYQIFKTLQATRLATAFGADADSFGSDFLFARYPAVNSTGQMLFTRFTAPNTLQIPLNTAVKTSDGGVTFLVIADSNNPAYNEVLRAYVMNPGVMQVSVLVKAIVAGSIGNVSANTITKIASNLPIGSVTNPAPFFNGVDSESDDAYKNRFQFYINSRYASTRLAIENAIINTQPNVTYTIQENIDAANNSLPGNVLIYVDDGTGSPPDLLIRALQDNIEQVRPASVSFSLEPANVVIVSIEFATQFNTGYNRNNYIGQLSTAVINYINSLPVGSTLFLTKLYQVIYDAAPSALRDVYGLTINNVADDLLIAPSQVARFISAIPAGTFTPVSQMIID